MASIRVLAITLVAASLAATSASAQKCSAAQLNTIKQAKSPAAGRVQSAYFAVTGTGSAAPAASSSRHRQAKDFAETMLNADIDRNNVDEVLRSMNATLLSPSLTFNCPAKSAKGCKLNAGFVEPGKYAISLCPRFFTDKPEQRVRTLVHESAHVAKIYLRDEEAYCVVYDCSNSCGGSGDTKWSMADNWGHFVHCASGQKADAADSIGGKKPGSKPPAKGKKK